MPVYLLDDRLVFPDPALSDKEGLVAVGGDLSMERLLLAYQMGMFPWFNPGEPILWWCPDPRYVLLPDQLKISKSMRSLLRKNPFRVTFDTAFEAVIKACAGRSIGRTEGGTWITRDMILAYAALHRNGFAHSVEVWQEDKLVAGLYGISLGRVFFGESMFTRVPNASKYGFIHLVQVLKAQHFELIDCQQGTPHLISLGAEPMPRDAFLRVLKAQQPASTLRGSWSGFVLQPTSDDVSLPL